MQSQSPRQSVNQGAPVRRQSEGHGQGQVGTRQNSFFGLDLTKLLGLDGIGRDSDTSLILMMLALLSDNGGDELLKLALLYIML